MAKALVFAAIFAVVRIAAAETVWIDTDVAIGSPIRDVDDAYALVFAFHSPELRIAGISASYGNAPLGHTTKVAREMTQRFGPEGVLVFAGANSAADLRRPTEASAALADVLEKNSITYLALGPLTNLATFIELHPELARRIKRVIFVGGQAEATTLALGPKKTFQIHDANVFKNPRAAAIVLRSRIPITLTPVPAAAELMITEKEMRDLESSGEAAKYLAQRSKIWLWFWTHFVGTDGGPTFDALAVGAAVKPNLVSTDRRYARMDQAGNMVVSRRVATAARPVQYCTRFAPELKRVFVERLLKQ